MLFSHFLPSVRWNAVIRALDFKPFENSIFVSSPPRAAFGSLSLNMYVWAAETFHGGFFHHGL